MLSRTASAIYWMSRYLERAEATARLIEVNLHLSLDLPGGEDEAWEAVVASTGDLEPFTERYGDATRQGALRFLSFDVVNPNSVLACVRLVRENARTVREQLPAEAWEGVNELNLQLREAALASESLEGLDTALAAVRAAGRQLEGQLEAALLRDEGWHFAQLGRQTERADQTSRLVDVQHALLEGRSDEPGHELRWEAVLKSASALTMYRRRHGATRGPQVAEFLLLEAAFPRSLAFTLARAEEALRAITGTPAGQFRNAAEKALGKLAYELRYTELDDVLKEGVHQWLDAFQERLNAVGAAVHGEYFAPPQAAAPAPLAGFEQPQQQQQQ